MIHIPEIDLKHKNVMVTIFILLILFFLLGNVDIKTLVSILVIFFLFNQYDAIKKNIKKNVLTKKEKVPIRYTHAITDILSKLKKYKKYNPDIYQQGMYSWVKFTKLLDLLENDELFNYTQYFENAQLYLQKSTNHFQSIGVSSVERKYIDGLKFHDFTNSKELMEISKLSKDLYKEGYQLLYNLSLRLNKRWEDKPSQYNKQIVLDHPLPHDKGTTSYDFYL